MTYSYDRQVCRWEEDITQNLPNPALPNIEAAKRYVDRIWFKHARWYKPQYKSSPSVELATGDKLLEMQRDDQIAWAGIGHKGHRIVLRPEGLYPLDCLHEVAHLLMPKRGHDQRFVGTLLSLLESEFDTFDVGYAHDAASEFGVQTLPVTYSRSSNNGNT